MASPFNCPLPSGSDPPVSATVAHPFPNAPTLALAGDSTFLNTWVSSTPAPTSTGGAPNKPPPPSPPAPTYVTGQCGLHVIQYQRRENGLNPTDNFLLEATLFDGGQHPIGVSGQVPAPLNVPVSVPGLATPFTITAAATDDAAALVCDFNGRKFHLDEQTCGKKAIGRYDHGSRNIDCGFPC